MLHRTASSPAASSSHLPPNPPATAAFADKRPLVVCGPSGSGKSSLLSRLFAQFPSDFAFSVSHTTREPRPGELNGREYHFVSTDQFGRLVVDRSFLEHTTFAGNSYGTSLQAVRDVQARGRVCVLDVELNGVRALKLQQASMPCRFVYVSPPSIDTLKERLTARATETPQSLQRRLQMAHREMEAARTEPHLFDRIIVNDDLEHAYHQFSDYVIYSR